MQKGPANAIFMHGQNTIDEKKEIGERLHAVVDRMLAPYGKTSPRGRATLIGPFEPFDVSKPNQHDSKAEFQREFEAVETILGHVKEIVFQLYKGGDEHAVTLERLRPIIDQKFRVRAPKGEVNEAIDLVRKCVADVGGSYAITMIMLDFWASLEDRFNELKDQKSKFWSLSHRAPDYHARSLALRLAKLFARETGERPTTGTSGETGEPSTSFSRALAEVFEILGIKSGIRGPAEWSVNEIVEDDLKPPIKYLSGLASPLAGARPRSNISDIVDALQAKSPKD